MPRKQQQPSAESAFKVEPIYRYWVEIRDLQSDSIRTLPLKPMQRVFIPTKKNQPDRPREEFLELNDASEIIEARDVDQLVAKLRGKYPDGRYERTLFSKRDPEAEERRSNALNSLVEIIAQAAVREVIDQEQKGIKGP